MRLAHWPAAGFVLAAGLFFLPWVSNPFAPRWAVLYLACSGALVYAAYRLAETRRISLTMADLFGVFFILWSASSIHWSGDYKQGYFQLLNLIALSAVYFIVSRSDGEGFVTGATVATLIAAVLWNRMESSTYGGFGNRNFVTEFLVIGIPLCFACRHRWLGWLAAILAFIQLGLWWNDGFAKYAALGCVILTFLVLNRKYYWALILPLAGFIAICFALEQGWLNDEVLRPFRQRLELAINTIALWSEAPFYGHGFGSFNYEYPRVQESHLELLPNMGTFMSPVSMYAGASHNEVLQLGAELGLTGLLLVGLFLWFLLRGPFYQRGRDEVAGLYALTGAFGLLLVGFPLQNPSSACLVAIALGLLNKGERFEIDLGRVVHVPSVAALSLSGLILWATVLYTKSQEQFSEARWALLNGRAAHAIIANLRAVETFPLDWLPRHQIGLTLTYLSVADTKSVIEPAAGDAIDGIAKSASPWSPSTRLARINYLLASNRLEEKRDEIEQTLNDLKSTASRQGSLWVTEALVAAQLNDVGRFSNALNTGYHAANPSDPAREDILNMAKAVSNEAGS